MPVEIYTGLKDLLREVVDYNNEHVNYDDSDYVSSGICGRVPSTFFTTYIDNFCAGNTELMFERAHPDLKAFLLPKLRPFQYVTQEQLEAYENNPPKLVKSSYNRVTELLRLTEVMQVWETLTSTTVNRTFPGLLRFLDDGVTVEFYPDTVSVFTGRTAKTSISKYMRKSPFMQHSCVQRYIRINHTSDDEFLAWVSNYCRLMNNLMETGEIKFATDADDIARVYTDGPRSCMSIPGGYIHPARVYANDTTAVAYLEIEGRIVSRAVVNRETKTFLTVYGNSCLETLLERDGWEGSEATLQEVHLALIESEEGIVCPYLDGNYTYATPRGDSLFVNDYGDYNSQDTTTGVLREMEMCEHCEDHYPPDTMSHVITWDDYNECSRSHEYALCRYCIDNSFVYSEPEDCYIESDEAYWVASTCEYVPSSISHRYEHEDCEDDY